MKLLAFLIVIVAVSTTYTSCTKDKAPAAIVKDPDCSDTISFSQDIQPLMTNYCTSCHDQGSGTGFTSTNYTDISQKASEAVDRMHGTGGALMPEGGPALSEEQIKMVQCWIQNNKPNN